METIKRKGRYEYSNLGWHQNQSSLVVPKAAEAALLRGEDVREFINRHDNMYDFMIRAKAPRGSSLELVTGDGVVPMQSTLRYYIANEGGSLRKISPPTGVPGQYKKAQKVKEQVYNEWHRINGNVWNPDIHTKNKSTHEERELGISVGWLAAECNHINSFDWGNLNREYYIAEALKLIEPLKELEL